MLTKKTVTKQRAATDQLEGPLFHIDVDMNYEGRVCGMVYLKLRICRGGSSSNSVS